METLGKDLNQLREDYKEIKAPDFMASRIRAHVRTEKLKRRPLIPALMTFMLALVLIATIPMFHDSSFIEINKFWSPSTRKPKPFSVSLNRIPAPRISQMDRVSTNMGMYLKNKSNNKD